MPVNHSSSLDKLLDYMPDLMEKANNMMNKCVQTKKEQTQKIIKEMQKKQQKNNKNEDQTTKEKEPKTVEKTIIQEEPKNSEEMYEFEYDETLEDE